MRADGEGDRQLLPARDAARVDALQVRRRRHVGAGLGLAAEAQAPAADIAPAGRGVDRVVDRRAEITAPVIGMMRIERQLGEIDVLAGQHDFVHRRLVRGNFDDRLRRREALPVFVVELLLAHVEGGGKPLAVARGLGGKLDALGPRLLEQHRLVRALDDLAHLGKRHGLGMDLDFAHVDEPVDEAPQAVLVHVDVGADAGLGIHELPPWSACGAGFFRRTRACGSRCFRAAARWAARSGRRSRYARSSARDRPSRTCTP